MSDEVVESDMREATKLWQELRRRVWVMGLTIEVKQDSDIDPALENYLDDRAKVAFHGVYDVIEDIEELLRESGLVDEIADTDWLEINQRF